MSGKKFGKVRVMKYVERPSSKNLHKISLLLRKEQRVTIGVVLLVVASVLIVSSFMFLIPSTLTGNNAVYTSYTLNPNENTNFQLQFHVAPNSYENITYKIGTGSYAHLKLVQEPYQLLGTGKQTTVLTKNLSSSGLFSYHEGRGSEVDTFYITLYSTSKASFSSFNITVTSYYPDNVNVYLLGGGVVSIAAFAIVMALLMERINQNYEGYWLNLEQGEDDTKRRKRFKIVSIKGRVKREIKGTPLILFVISVALMSLDQAAFAGTAGVGTFQLMISLLVLAVSAILVLYSVVIMAAHWIIGETYQ